MRKSLLKTIVATAVVGATMALSSVAAWAYDYTENFNTSYYSGLNWSKTPSEATDGVKNSNIVINDHLTINGNAFNKGIKFNAKTNGKNNVNKAIIIAEVGDTISLKATTSATWALYDDSTGNGKMYGTAQTGKDVTFKQIETAGTYYIVDTATNSHVSEIKSVSGTLATKYTISGSISNTQGYTGNIVIGDNDATLDASEDSYSISLADGTYSLALSNGLYSVTPASITVNGANATIPVTISKKETVNITGDIDSNLGITSKIVFTDTSGNKYNATITGTTYSVEIPKNAGVVTVSVLDDPGYLESKYILDGKSVTVSADDVDFDLEAVEITEWDFSLVGTDYPVVEWQTTKTETSITKTYKGLTVALTNSGDSYGKFSVSSSDKRVQVNKPSTITVSGLKEGEKVVVYNKEKVPNSNYTVSGNTITTNNNNFIYKIAIVNTTLNDDTYTGEGGLVVVKDNNVYAIGKVVISDISTVSSKKAKLTVGNKEFAKSTVVYKAVKIGDTPVTSEEENTYYLGAKINNVPNNEKAESLASKITLTLS